MEYFPTFGVLTYMFPIYLSSYGLPTYLFTHLLIYDKDNEKPKWGLHMAYLRAYLGLPRGLDTLKDTYGL
jgi:hypothetical protein